VPSSRACRPGPKVSQPHSSPLLPRLAIAAISVALGIHLLLADGRLAALFLVGLLLGVTLYQCGFGFNVKVAHATHETPFSPRGRRAGGRG